MSLEDEAHQRAVADAVKAFAIGSAEVWKVLVNALTAAHLSVLARGPPAPPSVFPSEEPTSPDLSSGLACPACRAASRECELCHGKGTITREQFAAWRETLR